MSKNTHRRPVNLTSAVRNVTAQGRVVQTLGSMAATRNPNTLSGRDKAKGYIEKQGMSPDEIHHADTECLTIAPYVHASESISKWGLVLPHFIDGKEWQMRARMNQ